MSTPDVALLRALKPTITHLLATAKEHRDGDAPELAVAYAAAADAINTLARYYLEELK